MQHETSSSFFNDHSFHGDLMVNVFFFFCSSFSFFAIFTIKNNFCKETFFFFFFYDLHKSEAICAEMCYEICSQSKFTPLTPEKGIN